MYTNCVDLEFVWYSFFLNPNFVNWTYFATYNKAPYFTLNNWRISSQLRCVFFFCTVIWVSIQIVRYHFCAVRSRWLPSRRYSSICIGLWWSCSHICAVGTKLETPKFGQRYASRRFLDACNVCWESLESHVSLPGAADLELSSGWPNEEYSFCRLFALTFEEGDP